MSGFDYSKPPAAPGPPLKNSAYIGRYTNDYFGEISIFENDGGLTIVQRPKNKAFPMKHYDRDTFTYETEGENAVGRSGITFTIGPAKQHRWSWRISTCAAKECSNVSQRQTARQRISRLVRRRVILPVSSTSAPGVRCISSVVALTVLL
jgi:hypothetical protein